VQKEITYEGRTLEITLGHHHQGTKVWVDEWQNEKWNRRIAGNLHILQTDFEILCDIAAELFGDTIHAETLAPMLGIPIRLSEDADCGYCGKYEHYSLGRYEEKSFFYTCEECLFTEKKLDTPLRDYLEQLTDQNWHTLRALIEHQLGTIDPARDELAYRAYLSAKNFMTRSN
jgi:hypothetical protein